MSKLVDVSNNKTKQTEPHVFLSEADPAELTMKTAPHVRLVGFWPLSLVHAQLMEGFAADIAVDHLLNDIHSFIHIIAINIINQLARIANIFTVKNDSDLIAFE